MNNTWLGLARKSDSFPQEIKDWLLEAWGFDLDVSVRRLSPVLFWIVPASEEDRNKFRYGGSHFADGPLRRIDKWSESHGPVLEVDWVRIHGIPLHARRKEVFWKLGELMGLVEEIDSHCLNMEIVEFARVKILHPVSVAIPKTLLLDVDDLRF